MTITLTLSSRSAGASLDLSSWLSPSLLAQAGATGFGFPPVAVQWTEGAGDGAHYDAARVGARDLDIPLVAQGRSREELQALLDALSSILAPVNAPARLTYGDGRDAWWLDVVRTGGGDWSTGAETNAATWLWTGLSLRAGFPYWTRVAPESFEIRSGSRDVNWLAPFSMAEMRLASGAAFGVKDLHNTGTAPGWPVWTVTGPIRNLLLVGPAGETLSWRGELLEGEAMTIDVRASTIVDAHGANRFPELDDVPRFWPVPPGHSTVRIEAEATSAATLVVCQWWPARWVVV